MTRQTCYRPQQATVRLLSHLFCRLEGDRKAVSGLLEAVKQRLPQSRVRKAQQEYKKRFVSLSRKDKPSGEIIKAGSYKQGTGDVFVLHMQLCCTSLGQSKSATGQFSDAMFFVCRHC